MPSTTASASAREVVLSSVSDSTMQDPITGSITLSSNDPEAPATVIVVSLPMTRAQAIRVASGMTGLTLPGMMLDPGCRSGRRISPSPVRGPEPIQRRSLQILLSDTATTLAAADTSTKAS